MIGQPEILHLRNKDGAAFSYLYDKYAPVLYGVILKVTPDQIRASTILQESFVKIWQNLEKFNPDNSTLFTWMLGITINKCNKELMSPKPTLLRKIMHSAFPVPALHSFKFCESNSWKVFRQAITEKEEI